MILGKGSALTIDGTVKMDAIIMEGRKLRTGMYVMVFVYDDCIC